MKRGWIAWDETELPRAVFDARLDALRKVLAEHDLPGVLVYTDVWRSNRARYFSNFMPYWNRALLVVPREGPPVLLSSLSPRVYPWIRSVTVLDEIRPSPNLAQQALQFAAEKGWQRLGVLELDRLPWDLHQQLRAGPIEIAGIPAPLVPDDFEVAMYRRAVVMAREGVEAELASAPGIIDHEFVGRLENKFRHAGAEDLVILLTNGKTAPAPPRGEPLGPEFSVAVALEYRGHWVKIVRSASHRDPFPGRIHVERLAGPYPYEVSALQAPTILAMRFESYVADLRLFHGDTYWSGEQGLELL